MARTDTQLAQAVLERLGIVEPGGTATAAESQAVLDLYETAYQEYERTGIAFWSQTSIPEYVFGAAVDAVAGRYGHNKGIPLDPPADPRSTALNRLEEAGDRRLRLMASEPGSGEGVAGEYF